MEASSPTMPASASTDRKICRRLAPRIRSSASSRVRWPTMMEKVLKMVKPPTNREMKAKTRRAVEKNPKRLVDRTGRLVGHRLTADDLDIMRKDLGDGPLELGRVDPRLGQDVR